MAILPPGLRSRVISFMAASGSGTTEMAYVARPASTLRQLAMAFVVEDERQILFYEDRIKKMPLPVLKKHGIVQYKGNLASLATGRLSFEQRARVRVICKHRIQDFLRQRGRDPWGYRMLETDPVPDVLRYQALAASGGRCALCGATKD